VNQIQEPETDRQEATHLMSDIKRSLREWKVEYATTRNELKNMLAYIMKILNIIGFLHA
jgi:predicted GIY-YIG superfamily endonuclease